MRIAISGSHSLGKSTFVNDFIQVHPDYTYEQEPYRALREMHEIKFAEEQTCQHIELQFDYSINRVKGYSWGDKVIFDRCPADYIPYASYSVDYGHADITQAFVDGLYQGVREALAYLDLIVFIPINEQHPIALENDGHRPTHDLYRDWVDAAFKKLYRENLSTIIAKGTSLEVVEIVGNRESRLRQLEQFIDDFVTR